LRGHRNAPYAGPNATLGADGGVTFYTRAPWKNSKTVANRHFFERKAAGLLLACMATTVGGAPAARATDFTFGGSLALTTDYIYRGLSQSGSQGAVQADLHVDTSGGTFAGVWGSTRDHDLVPYADYDLEAYLGQRFDLTNDWNLSLGVRGHFYLGGPGSNTDDYWELSAALTYLDSWTFSLTVVPDAPRYWYEKSIPRSTAWVPELSAQYLIGWGLFATAGVGYYYVSGTGPGIYAANGYAYGNLGLAYVWRQFRLDVAYFRTGDNADDVLPYPSANDRVAATVSWRF